MKRTIFIALIGLASQTGFAQKYFTKTGVIDFKASVDTFEPVEATSNSTTAILNADNGEVAALIFVKSFHFKVALMEEHFNENYMDSDQFPKANFKGNLVKFQKSQLTREDQEFRLTGTLTIKGKVQVVDTMAKLRKEGEKIIANTKLELKPEDFDIEIPDIVREKIAQTVNVTLDFTLDEKK